MESFPLTTPPSSSRAALAGPQRNSMEDSDTSLTRKRPRLDSGSRSYRSMSADPVVPSPSLEESTRVHTSPPSFKTADKAASKDDVSTAPDSTPSKMTINVRDPRLSGMAFASIAIAHENHEHHIFAKDELNPSVNPEPSKAAQVPSSNLACSPPSPSQSPEIEVAEIEDMSQEPGQTRWRTLGNAQNPARVRDELWATFPSQGLARSVGEALEDVDRQLRHRGALADWIHSYLARTEPYLAVWPDIFAYEHGFWIGVVKIFNAFCKRITQKNPALPLQSDSNEEDRGSFQDLLTAFAGLTLRLAENDCQVLQGSASEDSAKLDLASFGSMECLCSGLTSSKSPLWRNIQIIYSWDPSVTISLIMEQISRPSFNGLDTLSRLLHQILHKARMIPDVTEKIAAIFDVVFQVMEHDPLPPQDVANIESDAFSLREANLTRGYAFFQAVSSVLQNFIGKQVPALTHDVCHSLLGHLSTLLHKITYASDELTTRLLQEQLGLLSPIAAAAAPIVAEEAWKFHLYRKCFLEGRMEIRIQGVESMQHELVQVHRTYVQGKTPAQHEVVSFLCDFIIDNKLIEYLVGVESHPRLIRLAGNIVGFLVVNHRYTEAQSDKIWDTVRSSQDPGVVGAILQMLPSIFNISDYPLLLYLVTKLTEVPLVSWDTKLITYADSLVVQTINKWNDLRRGFGMDDPPYKCCIQLIRGAYACGTVMFGKRRAISSFASQMLESLLVVGPSDRNRVRIYEDCIAAIAQQTALATGSICVINILLRHDTKMDIGRLANDFELVGLTIAEFENVTDQMSRGFQDRRAFEESLTVRLDLVQQMITSTPESIGTEKGWALWDVMIGSKAPDDLARESALVMLVNTTTSLRKRNPFIDACISEYLPKLPPRFYTRNILYFLNQVFRYEHLVEQMEQSEGDSFSNRLGIDMLWRIALVAPPNTIECKAIETLVEMYLDSPKARGTPKAAIERMHVDVVERCVRQLTDATSQLKASANGLFNSEEEATVSLSRYEERHLQRLSFSRSLLVLQELVHKIRAHPAYSPIPSTRSRVHSEIEEINGAPITIRYQPFNGGSSRPMKTLQIGDLDTLQDLMERFTAVTDFAKFTVIVGGQKIDTDECCNTTLRAASLHDKGLFLIKNIHTSDSIPHLTTTSAVKPLEREVMAHFSDFYHFLSLDEGLSINVSFLIPIVHVDAADAEIHKGSSSQGFMLHSIQVLAKALLIHGTSLNIPLTSNGQERAVAGLIECLLMFLRETARTESSNKTLSEHTVLVERLLSLSSIGDQIEELSLASPFICGSLGCILEASLHSEAYFKAFKDAGQLSTFLHKALIRDSRKTIRLGIARSIESICNHPTLESSQKHAFASYCWHSFDTLVPAILPYGHHAEEFCSVATTVLRSLDDKDRENLDLTSYIHTWCNLILGYHHDEVSRMVELRGQPPPVPLHFLTGAQFVGRDNLDWIIHGISDLVQWCIQYLKSMKKPIRIGGNLVESLVRVHLFPPISEAAGEERLPVVIPVLHPKTRSNLYNIALALSDDDTPFHRLISLIRGLLPHEEGLQAWSWGIAQPAEDSSYDANWNFDRTNAIRSPTGYPGLRNLTNTCYLNSLLTQLFMNFEFRRFILNADITDQCHSQRLLAESRALFAFMQGTSFKAVDTQGIADSLINYENTLIDVSVQMDVDEFYNLLFDRWESQILSDSGKKTFRAFYGGQLVQQIKSKECPHISEREEPFSAIQCDVQGKSSLTESLSAYVDGEVMEGDAVKRACLKDIPDNLIFHLKRFDYDIMTGMRHKINDRFDFPERIDMSPYNIQFLQDPEQPQSPDVFELVGILVHTGTAESGHYYSYIKECATKAGRGPPTWVEFNDADVTPFNPAQIPDLCFGGVTEPAGYAAAAYPKSWNAYMLFYQRDRGAGSDLQPSQPMEAAPAPSTTQVSVPADLEKRITIDNERFLRKYCLFDSTHARFVMALIDRLRAVNYGFCSEEHRMETDTILLALEYADQVLSRMKDSTDFEKTLDLLTVTIRGCPTCCKLALDWVADHRVAFRNLLLRCPAIRVRKSFADMVVRALRCLRENDPLEYGFDVDVLELKSGNAVLPESPCGILQRIVSNARELWPCLHLHARAWDEFFGLLAAIAAFGTPETFILLREDFLRSCLEILLIESPGTKRLRVDNPHYNQLLRLIEKGRRYSFANLTELLQNLLVKIDLQAQPLDLTYHDRPQMNNGYFPLSSIEESYLLYGTEAGRSRPLVFLDKIISSNANKAAVKRILQLMITAEPRAGRLGDIAKTILNGVNIEPADLAEPHLTAALTFCETSTNLPAIRDVIHQIAREVDTIGTSGGAAHLEFFVQARQLINPRISRRSFNRLILRTAAAWGPPLLMYYDDSVRHATVVFLRELIFQPGPPNGEGRDDNERSEDYARALCEACIKRVHEHVVQQQSPIEMKCVEMVREVIRHCIATYFQTGTAEDDRMAEEAEVLDEAIRVLAVEEDDEANSDAWNNSDGDLPSESGSEHLLVSP
ncbi:MAG: hypothetical protein Q9220_007777 [cf. Caloplaca sp. 1 TL-2023]